ncbi:hypothetical protein FB45DRAFT_1032043 [Roridomyces roridus]|uniref:Uncharacterized protein n=1 Tax=Roridomyces roridus TaxID=1738132 RepID=A0AAD7FIT8_9AGAR|nr:hypothetical protein FB45DRAFT_1032043 [Roridomyces roridus]
MDSFTSLPATFDTTATVAGEASAVDVSHGLGAGDVDLPLDFERLGAGDAVAFCIFVALQADTCLLLPIIILSIGAIRPIPLITVYRSTLVHLPITVVLVLYPTSETILVSDDAASTSELSSGGLPVNEEQPGSGTSVAWCVVA